MATGQMTRSWTPCAQMEPVRDFRACADDSAPNREELWGLGSTLMRQNHRRANWPSFQGLVAEPHWSVNSFANKEVSPDPHLQILQQGSGRPSPAGTGSTRAPITWWRWVLFRRWLLRAPEFLPRARAL